MDRLETPLDLDGRVAEGRDRRPVERFEELGMLPEPSRAPCPHVVAQRLAQKHAAGRPEARLRVPLSMGAEEGLGVAGGELDLPLGDRRFAAAPGRQEGRERGIQGDRPGRARSWRFR